MPLQNNSDRAEDARLTCFERAELIHFFEQIFGFDFGYGFCIADKAPGLRRLNQIFVRWPMLSYDSLFAYLERCEQAGHDVYFCPTLLTAAKRTKANVIDNIGCLWADLDTCHPQSCVRPPSIVVESSPGRYQAYWLVDPPIEKYTAERINRNLAYANRGNGADVSGWDLTQLLRVPFTRNFKYPSAPLVRIIK